MKMHENLKKEGKSRKTISLGEGLRYDVSCTPRAFLIHAELFSGTLRMGNEVLFKRIWHGLRENAWFPWQPHI